MSEENKWAKLKEIVEEIVRRVVREELQAAKPKRSVTTSIKLKGSSWVGITQDHIDAWRVAYPHVDIENELRHLAAWCVSNKNKQPKSQFARFINRNLRKEHNRTVRDPIKADGGDSLRTVSAVERRASELGIKPWDARIDRTWQDWADQVREADRTKRAEA